MENKFFYCYSPRLKVFISDHGIKYITKGLHNTTKRYFWQYERTDELKQVLDQWK